ncbi:MAG: hypothetical protein GY702_13840 [Desulfobulbaceae bacterium]|nr:hypothetical protein [Desulfobulbaceae bacterium]
MSKPTKPILIGFAKFLSVPAAMAASIFEKGETVSRESLLKRGEEVKLCPLMGGG